MKKKIIITIAIVLVIAVIVGVAIALGGKDKGEKDLILPEAKNDYIETKLPDVAEKVEEKAPEVANCLTSVYPNFFFRKRLRKNTRGL